MAIEAGRDRAQFQSSPMVDYVVKGGWYTLWVALGVALFAFVDRQVLTLAAAPMSLSLGLSDSQLGLVQGLAFAAFTVGATYPIAWAADRFDRRLVLGLCLITWSLGTAACGLAQNFEQLFIAAVAIAAGEAGVIPIIYSSIPDLFKGRKRLLANSLTYFFAYLGISGGLALGGGAIGALDALHGDLPPTLQQFESWRLAFFAVALPAPVLLLLLVFTRLGRKQADHVLTERPAASASLRPLFRAHGKAILCTLGGLATFVLAFGGYLIWLPVVFTRIFGTTPAENGAGLGLATALGTVVGVASSTLIVRRMFPMMGRSAPIRFAWVSSLVFLPVLLVFPFITSAVQGFLLFGMLMLVGTSVGCMVATILQDMAPAPLRTRMLAINAIATGLLGGSAPTLVGWVSNALGPDPHSLLNAITIVALPTWIIAILLLRLGEKPFAALTEHVALTDLEAARAK